MLCDPILSLSVPPLCPTSLSEVGKAGQEGDTLLAPLRVQTEVAEQPSGQLSLLDLEERQ